MLHVHGVVSASIPMYILCCMFCCCGQGFQSPHDVVSATTDQAVYVGELSPAAVWKFSAKPMEDSNVSGKGSSPSLLSESSSPLKPVIDVMSVKNSVKSSTFFSTHCISIERTGVFYALICT